MGHSSSGLGEKIQMQRVWGKGAWMLRSSHWFPEFLISSGKPHLHFCPRPTFPHPGLGSEGKLISSTQIPPAASPMEGPENRGVREKILKINSWASPSPADWLSGALRVSFQFVVATAAGQGVEGEGERDSSSFGCWGFGKQKPNILYPLHPKEGCAGAGGGGTFEKKSFFLEAVKSSLPVFPITSAWVQKLPCSQPESPSSTGRAGPGARTAVEDLAFPRCPLAQTWAPPAKTDGCQCYHRRRPDGRCLGQGQVPWEGMYSNCK